MLSEDGVDGEKRASRLGGLADVKTLAAEAIGAGLLAFIVVAAGILAERFAIFNVGVALLMTALAGAAGFAALAFALRPATAFNPALALVLVLNDRLPLTAAILYASAQIAAAFLGVMAAHLVTNTGLVQAATQVETGEGVWLGEFVGAAIFVFAMLTAADREGEGDGSALIGGLCLLAIALATPSISFANPALTLARALTDSFTAIRLTDALVICGMQFAGALGAWALRSWLFPQDETR